jgi:hypothetical protein
MEIYLCMTYHIRPAYVRGWSGDQCHAWHGQFSFKGHCLDHPIPLPILELQENINLVHVDILVQCPYSRLVSTNSTNVAIW